MRNFPCRSVNRPRRKRRKSITQNMRQQVAKRFGAEPGNITFTQCLYCGEQLTYDWSNVDRVRLLDSTGRPTPCLDHVIPLDQNGPHTCDNLVPSCVSCNSRKCAAMPTAAELEHIQALSSRLAAS